MNNKNHFDKFEICDKEMLLEFFVIYSRFEYALKRSGFFNKNCNYPAAGCIKFIKKNESKFKKDKTEELQEAVNYLLENPAKEQIFNKGELEFKEYKADSDSETVNIFHSIRITRNNLFHGGKYTTGPINGTERDEKLIKNSIIVLKEFIEMNEKVKRIFWEAEE